MCSACGITTCKDGLCRRRAKDLLTQVKTVGAVQGRPIRSTPFVYGAPFVSSPFISPTSRGYQRSPTALPGTAGAPPPAMMAPSSFTGRETTNPVPPGPTQYVNDVQGQGDGYPSLNPEYIRSYIDDKLAQYVKQNDPYAMGTGNRKFLGATDPPPPLQAPAGLNSDQWFSMTPDQQTMYLKADAAQQAQIAAAITSGVSSTINGVFSTIKTQQDNDDKSAQRAHEITLAQIAAKSALDLAKLNAAATANKPPEQVYTFVKDTSAPATGGSQDNTGGSQGNKSSGESGGSSGGGSGTLILLLGAAAAAYFFMGNKN